MAYETGTASSQQDLVEKLATFAVANGWTLDEAWESTNRRMFLSKGTVFVGFKTSPPAGGGGVGIWHALGYSGVPGGLGQQPGDSGQGTLNPSGATNVTSGPRLSGIGDGPYTAYHFFADGNYIHVVLEFSPGLYRHLSFGILEKTNDWTGGEYAAAHHHITAGAQANQITAVQHTILTDSLHSIAATAGTLHIEGMPNQSGNQKWALFVNTTVVGNDRQSPAQPRTTVHGGMRGNNIVLSALGFHRASLLSGHVPMVPVVVMNRDRTVSPERVSVLGALPDVRVMQMASFSSGQEFSVGADTWIVFPAVRKQFLQQSGVQESRNFGVAYKKITS